MLAAIVARLESSSALQGRITLLLGPPGSGKSAFMQVLAGRMKASGFLRVSGDLRYNGVSPKDFNIARTAAYVHQFDSHIAGLTVHETLTFARACQVPNDSAGEFNVFTELRRVRSISVHISCQVPFLLVCCMSLRFAMG